MKRLLKYILLCLLWTFMYSLNAQIATYIEAQSGRTTIGDHFKVSYTIDRDPQLVVESMDFSIFKDSAWIKIIDTTGIVEMQKSGSVQMDFSFTFSLYKEGFVNIPGIPIHYSYGGIRDTAFTDPVRVKVEFLPNPESIAPLKDIIIEPAKWYDHLWYFVIALLILILILWFVLRRRKTERPINWETPKPQLPERHAHEIALEQLYLLEQKNLLEKGLMKDFQVELTEIMRNYIKARFKINSTELTTNETLNELSSKITNRQLLAVREVLNIADLVKFAKYQPAGSIHLTLLEKARNFFIKTAKNIPHL